MVLSAGTSNGIPKSDSNAPKSGLEPAGKGRDFPLISTVFVKVALPAPIAGLLLNNW